MSEKSKQFFKKAELDLGSPFDSASVLNFKKIVDEDDREVFPEAGCREVDRIGIHRWMVLKEMGGKFESFPDLCEAVRVVARRDLSTALAKGKCVLGSLPTWIAGTDAQKQRISDVILAGGFLALGLTEKSNGSDLAQSQVTAQKQADGDFNLNGEKWLINNGTQSTCFSVLARTNPSGGGLGFSLFLFDKDKKSEKTFTPYPKIKLLGVRGIDISGMQFTDAPLAKTDLIGREGQGLELSMKTLQVSRIFCASLCLGPVETVLRLVFEFCQKRRLYKDSVLQIPNVKSRLVKSFSQLRLCDLMTRTCLRGLHLMPEQMSLYSSMAKYFVPLLSEEAMKDLCVTLGARHFIREEFASGIVQKMLRDIQLIGLFDGSSQVNLYVMAHQLPILAQQRTSMEASLREDLLGPLFAKDFSGTDLTFRKLQLTNRGVDDLLMGLKAICEQSQALPRIDELSSWTQLRPRLLRQIELLDRCALEGAQKNEAPNQRVYFENAHRFCWLQASAMILFSHAWGDPWPVAQTEYLLDLCLRELSGETLLTEESLRQFEETLGQELQTKVEGNISLGLDENLLSSWYGHL